MTPIALSADIQTFRYRIALAKAAIAELDRADKEREK